MSAPRYPRPAVLETLAPGGVLARLAVIQASAGTGKTFLIERAVVELLLTGAPIQELLVVTFSEKATVELRVRIRALLGELVALEATPAGTGALAWTLDEPTRALLRQALEDFDQAAIHTIHGFCHRVLRENAFLLGSLLQQEVVDAEEVFREAFRRALREAFALPPLEKELEAWLVNGRSVDDLRKLLQKVHGKRAEVRPELDREQLSKAAEVLVTLLRSEAFDGLAPAVEGTSMNGRTRKAILDRLALLAKLRDRWSEVPSLLALHVDRELKKVLDYLLQDHVFSALSSAGDDASALAEALRSLEDRLTTYEAAAAQLFLPEVVSRAEAAKQEVGGYDFGDMLQRVRRGVCGDGPLNQRLVARIRGQFRHALIDEFQDTDDLQWDTFRRVFVESEHGHGLWVVGDPKQAIYGFRGGDVFSYLRARRELLERGAVEAPLRQNWRSTEAVLSALHHLYDPGADPSFFRGGEIEYDPEVSAGSPAPELKAGDEVLTPIKLCQIAGADLKAGEIRELHGRWIAAQVRELQDRGLTLTHRGEERPLALGDVFVLTRTAREGVEVAGYLREAGVRYAFYRQGGLLKTSEADDILRLLAAIESPWSRARRAEAWTTPFFGLALSDLPAAERAPAEHPLQRQLRAWRELAERRRYPALFARILADSGLLRREVFLRESERQLTNYLHVFELLLGEVGPARLELREVVQLLRSWIAETRRPTREDGDSQRLETDADAVQIMTMHKSKGLEAACVLLFGGITHRKSDSVFLYHEEQKLSPELSQEERNKAWKRAQNRRKAELEESAGEGVFVYNDASGQRVVHVGNPTGAILDQIRREREDEERRLIYVATTRAKGRLFLPAFARGDEGWCFPKLGGCMLPLAERLADLEEAGDLPADLFEVDAVSLADPPQRLTPPDLSALDAWAPPGELLDPRDSLSEACAARRADPAHAARVVTSYSRLKAVAARAEGAAISSAPGPGEGHKHPADAEAPSLERDDLPGGATMGSYVHELFERVDFSELRAAEDPDEWLARPQVSELLAGAARRYGVAEEHQPLAGRLVYDSLRAPVELPCSSLPEGLCAVEDPLPEPEFLFPVLDASSLPGEFKACAGDPSRAFARGFLDLVFRHEGKAYFLDWKTDRLAGYAPGPEGPLARHVEAHYGIQLRLYSLALARFLRLSDEEDHAQRFGGAVYAFVRGMRPNQSTGDGLYALRPSWQDLLAWEQELSAKETFV